MPTKRPFTLLFGLAILSALATACSGNDGKISVASSNAALTDKGGDPLFTIKLDEARDDGYALDDTLKVKVTPDGKSTVLVVCTAKDANGNKKLDQGELLTCVEGANNDLDATIAGKVSKVELFSTIDGDEERIGDAEWTAK